VIDKNVAFKAVLNELSNFPIFQGLQRANIEKMCEGAQVVVTPHRQALYQIGDDAHSFGIVLGGAYKLSKPTPQGDESIIHFATAGDVIAALIMAQPHSKYLISAVAMGPSRFLKIPRQTYLNAWIQLPEVVVRVQNFLTMRMGQLHSQKILTKASLPTKLAFLLIEMLKRSKAQDDLVLPLPLTRKELADHLGTSVESVIRVMSEWSKIGLIETNEHQIKILNLEKMLQIATWES
jgi:CRP-like cAMP-binding protein